MVMAVWCLFTFVGAWVTLRHTRLYTLKSTFRTIGLTVLMLATAASAIFLATRIVDGRSVAVQTLTLAGVVILCTLGLIFGVSTVSTPAGARLTTTLPPDVTPVTVYRARILPWVWVAASILGVSLLMMLVPGPVHFIAGIFAAIVAFFGVIMFPTAYVTALRLDRAVTALQLHPWLHWHYPANTWSEWIKRLADVEAKAEAVTLSTGARRGTIITVTVFAALYAVYVVPASMTVRLASGIVSGLVVLALALLTRPQSRHAAQRLYKQLQAAPPETYFGTDGVFCNGEFCAWRAIDVYLLSASVDSGPPRHLEFWFEKILSGAYAGPQVTKVRKQVLIAADAAASDLATLQAALLARCPDARINLS